MDKKIEDMSVDELKEYNAQLEKEELLRKAQKLEADKEIALKQEKELANQKLRADIKAEVEKEYLANLAKENTGSASQDTKVETSKAGSNQEVELTREKLKNSFEANKVILGIPESRKLEGLGVEEIYKRLKAGYYRRR